MLREAHVQTLSGDFSGIGAAFLPKHCIEISGTVVACEKEL
jgi:hypothetical protein